MKAIQFQTEYNHMNLHDRDIIRAAKREGRAEGAHENAIETAKLLFVDGRYSIKEISELLGIAEEELVIATNSSVDK